MTTPPANADLSRAVGAFTTQLALPGMAQFPTSSDLSTFVLQDQLGFQCHKPHQAQQLAPVSAAMRALSANPILQSTFGTGPEGVKAVHALLQQETQFWAGKLVTAPHVLDSVLGNGAARVASISGSVGDVGGFWSDGAGDDGKRSLASRMQAASQVQSLAGLTEFAKQVAGQMAGAAPGGQ